MKRKKSNNRGLKNFRSKKILRKKRKVVILRAWKRKRTKKGKIKRHFSTNDRVYYTLDPNFEFYQELRSLILKSSPAEKTKMLKRISGLGRVRLAVISGVFLNGYDNKDTFDSEVDLFIVGDDLDKRKLRSFLKALEAEVGKEIRFGLMDKDEFQYRYGMFDRFVRVLLEGPHEKLINKLGL